MAGKTRIAGKKDQRGGKRPGAGKKKKTLPKSAIDKMRATMAAAKKKYKIDEDDFLVMAITKGKTPEGGDVNFKERLAAVKIFKDFTMPKQSEQKITKTEIKLPKIYLPEELPDPALKVVDGGKES